ncbi:MAG: FAD-dependent oxidoreductase [Desulfotalea sp.]
MKFPLIIIGGGLSGLAAAIRCSRFIPEVLVLEQHSRLGGLNSYYYRNKRLYETGLHAITNYAEPKDKKAPINKLFRQLQIKREILDIRPQKKSQILFKGQTTLSFSNDFELLTSEIANKFPHCIDNFSLMLERLAEVNPYQPSPYISTKAFLKNILNDELLVDMILCPLMYYGSSVENDMDLSQFAIMFKSIYQEGMFRPAGTIYDFLSTLEKKIIDNGGSIRKNTGVKKILFDKKKAKAVELATGEVIECDYLLSTIGHYETMNLCNEAPVNKEISQKGRLGFIETIYQLPIQKASELPKDTTITFYNKAKKFNYQHTNLGADLESGVICFPQNFQNLPPNEYMEVRSTHLASFEYWQNLANLGDNKEAYNTKKRETAFQSAYSIEDLIGKFYQNAVYIDTFTPVTIKRYTAKIAGAIYGAPNKIKDGDIGYSNFYLAGTDQGFLGIIGSMLSGVSIVNQHILPKL